MDELSTLYEKKIQLTCPHCQQYVILIKSGYTCNKKEGRQIRYKCNLCLKTIRAKHVSLTLNDLHLKRQSVYSKIENGERKPVRQWEIYDGKNANFNDYLDTLSSIFKRDILQKKVKLLKIQNKKLIDVLPIADLHIGLSSDVYTTDEVNTTEKYKEYCISAFSKILHDTPQSDHLHICNLGDYFHFDNFKKTTTKGTFQSTDVSYHQMVDIGITVFINIIEIAQTIYKKVTVHSVAGNHDYHTNIILLKALFFKYENNKNVDVVCNYKNIQSFTFGKSIFIVTHGDKIKKKLQDVSSAYFSKKWGECEYRYIMTGHIHHKILKEQIGYKVESFGSLVGTDEYSYGHGYKAQKNIEKITYHIEYGEVCRKTYSKKYLT